MLDCHCGSLVIEQNKPLRPFASQLLSYPVRRTFPIAQATCPFIIDIPSSPNHLSLDSDLTSDYHLYASASPNTSETRFHSPQSSSARYLGASIRSCDIFLYRNWVPFLSEYSFRYYARTGRGNNSTPVDDSQPRSFYPFSVTIPIFARDLDLTSPRILREEPPHVFLLGIALFSLLHYDFEIRTLFIFSGRVSLNTGTCHRGVRVYINDSKLGCWQSRHPSISQRTCPLPSYNPVVSAELTAILEAVNALQNFRTLITNPQVICIAF